MAILPPSPCPRSESLLIRAKHIYTFAGEKPACGKSLFSPLERLEDSAIFCRGGIIEDIGKKSRPACKVLDLGDAAILPPFFNCHTHLQLSYLEGKTLTGHGFTPWLKSLVPHVLRYAKTGLDQEAARAINAACATLQASGARGVGDIGGSLPGSLEKTAQALAEHSLAAELFCEHFGFQEHTSRWPARCEKAILENPALASRCAPAGHALYSTDAHTLRLAHKNCREAGKTFTFHLAESPDETELLAYGAGALAEYYRPFVLPPDWRPPGLSPLQYAKKLGILTKTALAVHGAQLSASEAAQFRDTGAALCLCCRSNDFIGVGLPNIKAMIDSGMRLCLGSDGLSSAPDLDIRKEVLFIQEKFDLPLAPLWRMAIINGARALNHPHPVIAKGEPAIFSIWPSDIFSDV